MVMEKIKLGLDVFAGIAMPLIVLAITVLWRPREAEREAIMNFLKTKVYPGLTAIAAIGAGVTIYGLRSGFYSENDPLSALTEDQKGWFQNFMVKNDAPGTKLDKFF